MNRLNSKNLLDYSRKLAEEQSNRLVEEQSNRLVEQ